MGVFSLLPPVGVSALPLCITEWATGATPLVPTQSPATAGTPSEVAAVVTECDDLHSGGRVARVA